MPEMLRFESYTMTSAPKHQLKVRSDGRVKTPLAALAKAKQTYSCGKPEQIISQAKDFNNLGETYDKLRGWIYTQKVLPVRELERHHLYAPEVNVADVEKVQRLLTAVLLFKGIGACDVKEALATFELDRQERIDRLYAMLADHTNPNNPHPDTIKTWIGRIKKEKPHVTYATNTRIYYGKEELIGNGLYTRPCVTVPRVTVKAVTDGNKMFFDSRTCNKVKIVLQVMDGFDF